MAETEDLKSFQYRFESDWGHQFVLHSTLILCTKQNNVKAISPVQLNLMTAIRYTYPKPVDSLTATLLEVLVIALYPRHPQVFESH